LHGGLPATLARAEKRIIRRWSRIARGWRLHPIRLPIRNGIRLFSSLGAYQDLKIDLPEPLRVFMFKFLETMSLATKPLKIGATIPPRAVTVLRSWHAGHIQLRMAVQGAHPQGVSRRPECPLRSAFHTTALLLSLITVSRSIKRVVSILWTHSGHEALSRALNEDFSTRIHLLWVAAWALSL